ncbi:MAG: nitroreductase family deazaflavin-dependent oxidoreductase [Actinoplanes sp.]
MSPVDPTPPPNATNLRVIDEFRNSGGLVATGGIGRRLILLHHVGRRTGQMRVTPVSAMPDGDGAWVVVAAPTRAPREPGWAVNIRATPALYVETESGIVAVVARELLGTERSATWEAFQRYMADLGNSENHPTWPYPLFRLERHAPTAR